MIGGFGNKLASDLFHKGHCKTLPRKFWKRAVQLLEIMEAVDHLLDLQTKGFPPSVRLHPLLGQRKGEWAIDIHKTSGWRITFKFRSNEFTDVKIVNYH